MDRQYEIDAWNTWRRGEYEASDDPARLDLDVVHGFLSEESYWARGQSRETIARCMANSLCVGIYRRGEQVAFARVITDYAVHAYLVDVFVLAAHRGQELGKWLIGCILGHPRLQQVTRWSLDTRDAQELYAQFGFEPSEPGRHMGCTRRVVER